jgi:hypothetical protein
LEREHWEQFVRWNERYEAGAAGVDSHPGQGGINTRYDELTALLAQHRQPPADTRRLLAEWRFDDGDRYRLDGLDYWVKWSQPN